MSLSVVWVVDISYHLFTLSTICMDSLDCNKIQWTVSVVNISRIDIGKLALSHFLGEV